MAEYPDPMAPSVLKLKYSLPALCFAIAACSDDPATVRYQEESELGSPPSEAERNAARLLGIGRGGRSPEGSSPYLAAQQCLIALSEFGARVKKLNILNDSQVRIMGAAQKIYEERMKVAAKSAGIDEGQIASDMAQNSRPDFNDPGGRPRLAIACITELSNEE